jgi:hypothetical protein
MGKRNAASKDRVTVLTGRRDNMTFEGWIEIDERPLEVYGEADL